MTEINLENQPDNSQSGGNPDSHQELGLNVLPIKSHSSIDLILNKDEFYSSDSAEGFVIISIAHPYNAKRLSFSILGEIISQTGPVVKKELLKRLKTSLNSLGETKIQRTFTAGRNTTNNETKSKVDPHSLTRTFTLMNKRQVVPISRSFSRANSRAIAPESRNHELFCHYSVPLFTFKTSTLPPGIYKVPFSFILSPKMLPTSEYSDKDMQVAVNYKVIAELEENADDDDDGEGPGILQGALKDTKNIKVYKGHAQESKATKCAEEAETEVSGKLRIPTFFCMSHSNDIKVQLKLPKTSFVVGERISYQLESIEKPLRENKNKVLVNIVEEVIMFGNNRDTRKTPLNSKVLFKDNESGGSLISSDVEIPKSMDVTSKMVGTKIEHFFEVILVHSNGARKQAISLRLPITFKKGDEEDKQALVQKVAATKGNLDEEEDIMVLPTAKFKMDEKFNLLNKTADILNDFF